MGCTARKPRVVSVTFREKDKIGKIGEKKKLLYHS
jgi:hypothetical protein